MTDHPLTESAAAEMWDEHHTPAHPILRWALAHESERKATLALLRAAFDAGQKYQDDLEDDTIRNIMQDVHHLRVERDDAVARAERAEDRLSDSVHVDEAARRVEAAREEGWDQATLWIDSYQGGPNGRTDSARSANPYRPVQELPAERDGVVLVPADGHKAITTTKGQEFARLTFTTKQDLWYGPNLAAQPGDWVIQTTAADRLTPGTWRAV